MIVSNVSLGIFRGLGRFFCKVGAVGVLVLNASCQPKDRPVTEAQVEGRADDNFAALQLRLWHPHNTKPPQGTLAVVLGAGMNGLHLADNPGWRQLAQSHGLALAAVHGVESGGRHSWHQAEHGSGRAFLKALEAAYRHAGMPGAAAKPLYVVGLSTGGQFAYHLALLFPERLGGFVTLKGGMHRLPRAEDPLTVPGLLVAGENDLPFRLENLAAVADHGRRRNAPWVHFVDPGTGHESERVTRLLPAWLQALQDGTLTGPAFQESLQAYLRSPETTGGPGLSLATHQPAPVATHSATTLDLGSWPWAKGSQAGTIRVQPASGSSWDRLEAVSVRGLYTLTVEGSTPSGHTLHVQAKPASHPLTAPIRDELRLTYFQGSRKLLACDRVTLHSRSTGPLRAVPATVLASSMNSIRTTLRLKIVPTAPGNPWHMARVEGSEGLRLLDWKSTPDPGGSWTVEAAIEAEPDAQGNVGGRVTIFATTQGSQEPYEIQVPFVGKLAQAVP